MNNTKPKTLNRKPSKPKPKQNKHKLNSPQTYIPSDIEVAKKLVNIYQSAENRKLECNLSFVSMKDLLSFPTCYYTGRTFENEGPYSRSIDRIDSAKGYIEGNVVSCTIDINGKKSNLSEEEIELLYKKIVEPKKKGITKKVQGPVIEDVFTELSDPVQEIEVEENITVQI